MFTLSPSICLSLFSFHLSLYISCPNSVLPLLFLFLSHSLSFVTFPSLCCEFPSILSFSTASVSLHFVFSFSFSPFRSFSSFFFHSRKTFSSASIEFFCLCLLEDFLYFQATYERKSSLAGIFTLMNPRYFSQVSKYK